MKRPPNLVAPVPAAAAAPSTSLHPDPPDKPLFTQHSGSIRAIELPTTDANVIGKLQTPRATYLLVRASHGQTLANVVLDSVTDGSGTPLTAAVAGSGSPRQSLTDPNYELVLRLAGDQRLAELTELQWTSRGTWGAKRWQGGYRQKLKLTGIDSAPIRTTLQREFGECIARWFEITVPQEPFAAFAASRTLRKLAQPTSKQPSDKPTRTSRLELLDLMDFYTGRSAVNDSLQVDRGLQLSERDQAYTEHIDALEPDKPPMVQRHTSRGPRCEVCSVLDDYLPADALVLQFAALRDLVNLPRQLDRRLGPLVRIAEASGGSHHLVERYRRQLALELDGFAETAGQFAARHVAVVLGDPYLVEGTDVALLFRAENQGLLQDALERHLQRAKREVSDIRTTQEVIEGQPVTLHTTPDARVRRFEYGFDDYRVVANSRSAIARMIRVRQRSVRSLSRDPEYVRVRTRRPFDVTKERASLYFGNEFVANLIGPRSRILGARRLRAKSELLAVDHAALLFGWMEGRAPASLAELLDSGWLERNDLKHFDRTPITWSPGTGARSRWGYAQSLVPIADLSIGKVSRDEATAYRRFRQRYQAEMSGVLDPTLLLFDRTSNEEEIATELSVFPIPIGGRFNTEFRHVAELVGNGHIEPGPAASGLSSSIAIGDSSPLRELFDSNVGNLFGKRAFTSSFVGDWAKVGLDEGAAVWDLAGQERWVPQIPQSAGAAETRPDIDQLIPRLPVWIAIHVRSRLLLTAAIAAIRAKLDSIAPDLVRWHEDTNHRKVQLHRIQVQADHSKGAISANVYYAVANDVLLLSLRRDVLRARIDEVLAGKTPRGMPLSPDVTQLVLDWRPEPGGWLQRTVTGIVDQAAVHAHERACAGLTVVSRGHAAFAAAQPDLAALRHLGYTPESPQGRALLWQNGQCEGGAYGTAVEPSVPDAKDPDLSLHELLRSISTLRVSLGIVPHQDALELRAHFRLGQATSNAVPER